MKPKTLVMSVLAVLLLAAAAWQLFDASRPEAVQLPSLETAEAAPPVLPAPVVQVAPMADVTSVPATEPAVPPIKRTMLPNGVILIENRPMTVRFADGRVEQRYVNVVARPKLMKKFTRPMKAFKPKEGETGEAADAQATESTEPAPTTTTVVVPVTGG